MDVTTGHVNVIWQADANAAILQSLRLCATPPAVLNVSGPETASVRWLAVRLAELLGSPPPTFIGEESETALLSNCAKQFALFGYPSLPLGRLLEWTADWIMNARPLLNKPTDSRRATGSSEHPVACRCHSFLLTWRPSSVGGRSFRLTRWR